jgi:hypothetical protein
MMAGCSCPARYAAMWRDMGREGFDEAVYWLELLIKYGDLEHLAINDFNLNIVQYLCLDVVALFLGILCLVVWAGRVCFMWWLRRSCVQKKKKKKLS